MPRAFAFSAFLLGFTSLLIQIVVARELLTSFLGNEMSIALVLLVWLLMVAAGSALAGRLLKDARRAAPALPWLQLAVAATLAPSVWMAQAAGGVGRFPGEVIGPGTMLVLAAAALAPPCLLLGALFAALCQVAEDEAGTGSVTTVYALEAIGAVAAGVLFHFVIADRLGSSQTAVLVAAANAAGAGWTSWRPRKQTLTGLCAGSILALNLAALAVLQPALHLGGTFGLDGPGLARRWHGMEVLAETNSRYGNLAVVREAGQVSFYEAGLPAFTTEAVQSNEIAIHTPLLMHPEPKRVLVISGGLGGGLGEVLKHPVDRADYVELDRELVDLACMYLPPALRRILDDPKIDLHYADGRAFVKTAPARYDVILVLVPDPATTALSRYYTREFFAELKRILGPSGIVCFQLSAAQTKLSGPRLYLHATVYRALREVFPAVLVLPGEETQYLAARSGRLLASGPSALVARMAERRVDAVFINEAWFDYAFSPVRRDMMMGSLDSARDVPANRDSRPISCHYWLRLWLEQLSPGAARLLRPVRQVVLAAWLLLPLGALLSVALRRRRSLPQLGAAVCIWGTGFLEMGAQLALILTYQAVAGYLYHQIGILMSLFMLGLAIGATIGRRLAVRGGRATFTFLGAALLAVVGLQAASAFCLPLLFAVGRAGLGLTGLIFGAAAAWMGALAGLNFPLAVSITAAAGGDEARAASRLYALDLAGASTAAMLIGALAIPAVGITLSCRALAAVLLASAPPLAAAVLRGSGRTG